MIKMIKPELLAPAGDMEKLKVAVIYGADAVYLGGQQFSLRAGATNFDRQELQAGIAFAHSHGVKIYVTANVFAHNQDLDNLAEYFRFLAESGADAVIASDPGVISILQEAAPDLPVHLSTQANTTNWASARFWQTLGVRRIVLARELALDEINQIHKRVAIELEAFVHGAMCMSYSGRCLLSNFMTGRDANRGDCAQACRWRYALMEEKRPGQYFPVEEDSRGTYFMSSKDLCLIHYLPQLVQAGVSSLKIEGRMKSIHYVGTLVKAYRAAIDTYVQDPEHYQVQPTWWQEINKVSHRDYTTGFLLGRPGEEGQLAGSDKSYQRPVSFVGLVRGHQSQTGLTEVEQRNNFKVGDRLEVLCPRGDNFISTVTRMFDHQGQPLTIAPHPQQTVYLPLGRVLEPMTMLRKID